VTITGAAFTSGAKVAFGGTSSTSVTVSSSTSITAVVPTGATTGTISVTTSAGTGTSSASFTVTGGSNLLLNPSFESWVSSTSVTSWCVYGGATVQQSTSAQGGSYSAQVWLPGGYYGGLCQGLGSFPAGSTFTYSAWAKAVSGTSDLTGPKLGFDIAYTDGTHDYPGGSFPTLSTSAWTQGTATVQGAAGKAISAVSVYLSSNTSPAQTVLFDNATLTAQ
jgi:hypothetical protein